MLVFMTRLPQKDQADDQRYFNTEVELFPENNDGYEQLREKIELYLTDLSKSPDYGPPDIDTFNSFSDFKCNGRANWKHGAFIEVQRLRINF